MIHDSNARTGKVSTVQGKEEMIIDHQDNLTMQRRGGARRPFAALLFGLLAVLVLMTTLALPANAQQAPEPKLSTGPTNPSTNYPFWYEDREGTRLEPCLEADPLCGEGAPTGPINSFADFPEEAFYWGGEAVLDVGDGGRAVLAIAQ